MVYSYGWQSVLALCWKPDRSNSIFLHVASPLAWASHSVATGFQEGALEAEAAVLLRHRLESSTVKMLTTFYWSRLEPTTLRGGGAKNLCHLSSTMPIILKKCCQQQNDFSVTYSKCLAYKCQNEVFWLFPSLSKKWVHQWVYRSEKTKNGRYWLGIIFIPAYLILAYKLQNN